MLDHKTILALVLFGCLLGSMASRTVGAESIAIEPKGEYAQIDTRLAIETMRLLAEGTTEERRKAIEKVNASPDRYAPPVLYLLSNVLFGDGKKEEAAFWFYAGQLRARFDANRCTDISAGAAVGALNEQYGPPINGFMFKRIAELENLIPQVVEWDRKTPHNYDHRWINLHGMKAFGSAPAPGDVPEALSLPEEQWSEIAERTRADYLEGFREAMTFLKKQKK